jgi:hypothetical protein
VHQGENLLIKMKSRCCSELDIERIAHDLQSLDGGRAVALLFILHFLKIFDNASASRN